METTETSDAQASPEIPAQDEFKRAVETLLFITDQPIPLSKLCSVLGEKDSGKVCAAIADIQREYAERAGPLQVLEIAEGFQMATRPGFAPYIRKLFAEKMVMRLSTAALETLSIIAYKQPLTRAEIEEIRGVEVIAALETLLEKRLIKVVGRKESVGRPLLYGTSPEFLRHFGLRSLGDLPPIDSFVVPEPAPLAPPEATSTATSATPEIQEPPSHKDAERADVAESDEPRVS